jgi:hypothetical protein
VIRSLATRIASGKTRFEPDLISALRLIDKGELTREELRGSWAGAFGRRSSCPPTSRRSRSTAMGTGAVACAPRP